MAAPTLGDFVRGPWRDACYFRCKPSTRARIDSALRTQLIPAFGAVPIDEIAPPQVHEWFEAYSETAPGGANRTLDVLAQIMRKAVEWGHASSNPARGVRRNPRVWRTRFLSRPEIHRLHQALDAHRGGESGRQQADIVRLLLLTGCRKGELVCLRWSEVRGNTLHLEDSKTGPRTVFLSGKAEAIIARQPTRSISLYVFPSPSDPTRPRSLELSLWRKVRKEARINDARLHDLRHTFASHAAMKGVPLPVVARLLGHAGTRMTWRYAHIGDNETQAASARVGAVLARALAAEGA